MILQKVGVTLGFGVLWLYLFSVPVAHNQRLFDVAFNVVVDTAPMNWLVSKVQGYFDMTKDMPAVEARVRGVEKKDMQAKGSAARLEP
jgi:hypothetical protein